MNSNVNEMTKNLEQMSQHLLQVFISDSMKGKDAGDVEQANRHVRKALAILTKYGNR
jgi:hypothetical protein